MKSNKRMFELFMIILFWATNLFSMTPGSLALNPFSLEAQIQEISLGMFMRGKTLEFYRNEENKIPGVLTKFSEPFNKEIVDAFADLLPLIDLWQDQQNDWDLFLYMHGGKPESIRNLVAQQCIKSCQEEHKKRDEAI